MSATVVYVLGVAKYINLISIHISKCYLYMSDYILKKKYLQNISKYCREILSITSKGTKRPVLKKIWEKTNKQEMCLSETQCPLLRRFEAIYWTFDLEWWPWPFTTPNMQLHEIQMYAKYQVAIFNIAKVLGSVKVLGHFKCYIPPYQRH